MDKHDTLRRNVLNKNRRSKDSESQETIDLLVKFGYLTKDMMENPKNIRKKKAERLNKKMSQIEDRIGDNRDVSLEWVLEDIKSSPRNLDVNASRGDAKKDSYMFFKSHKPVNAKIEDENHIVLSDQTNYRSLDGVLENLKGNVKLEKNELADILNSDEAERFTLWKHQDGKLVPYFKMSGVRRMLVDMGYENAVYRGRKAKKKTRLTTPTGKKLRNLQPTVMHKNQKYGRQFYWAKNLGIPKDTLSNTLKIYGSDTAVKTNTLSHVDNPEGVDVNKNVISLNSMAMQYIVDQIDAAVPAPNSAVVPEDDNKYKTAFEWSRQLKKEEGVGGRGTRSPSVSIGSAFINDLTRSQNENDNYVKIVDGVKVRVYHEDYATNQFQQTIKRMMDKYNETK